MTEVGICPKTGQECIWRTTALRAKNAYDASFNESDTTKSFMLEQMLARNCVNNVCIVEDAAYSLEFIDIRDLLVQQMQES
jgi:hypothetical protein